MKAAIFDLDGTLIDSMYVWSKADCILLSRYGHYPDNEYIEKITSLTFTEGIDYIIRKYNIDRTPIALKKEIFDIAYDEYAYKLLLKEGVFELLVKLKEKGIKIGMATSSIRVMCEALLKRTGIFDYFDAIVFSDEVGKNKTNSHIYLETARQLEVMPKDCIVFEDVIHAVKGAKKAGMKVIGVYDEYSKLYENEMRMLCDGYIYNMNEFLE